MHIYNLLLQRNKYISLATYNIISTTHNIRHYFNLNTSILLTFSHIKPLIIIWMYNLPIFLSTIIILTLYASLQHYIPKYSRFTCSTLLFTFFLTHTSHAISSLQLILTQTPKCIIIPLIHLEFKVANNG